MGVFDFLKNPGIEARQKRLLAEKDLAERKFAEQQASTKIKQQQESLDRSLKLLDRADLSQQARQAIGQRISQLPQFSADVQRVQQGRQAQAEGLVAPAKASLFDSLRAGNIPLQDVPQAVQGAGRTLQGLVDQPVNLFDFAAQPKTKAEQEADLLAKATIGKPTGEALDIVRGIKPPTQQDAMDEVQDIQDAVANGNLDPEAGGVQMQSLIKANPNAFKNVDIPTLTKLPTLKLASSVGGVDPAFFEKGVKSGIEKDITNGLTTVNGLVETLEGFQRGFLTGQGKIKGKLGRMADFIDQPDLFGSKEFTDNQSAFIRQAKSGFLVFRKFITGVAGGIQEFQEIGKAFPDADSEIFKGDTPAQFQSKSISAIESGMRAINLMQLMKNEGLDVTQKDVTSSIRRLPMSKVPLELQPGDTIESILGKQSTKESLATRLSIIKDGNARGAATIDNSPKKETQPKVLEDQLQFDEISKLLPDGKLAPFLTTHPKAISTIKFLLSEEQISPSEITDFLDFISSEGMSDEDAVKAMEDVING